ncbi:hypothetical protein [Weissella viridescens]|uniref:hypothetical protein n=1 Tax=Weissella viridescens TaxID=1629 RepID=UPI00163A191B|nr:hypothetical protein [Weissella viridescens]
MVVATKCDLNLAAQNATVLIKKANYPVDTMYIDTDHDEVMYLGLATITLADSTRL